MSRCKRDTASIQTLFISDAIIYSIPPKRDAFAWNKSFNHTALSVLILLNMKRKKLRMAVSFPLYLRVCTRKFVSMLHRYKLACAMLRTCVSLHRYARELVQMFAVAPLSNARLYSCKKSQSYRKITLGKNLVWFWRFLFILDFWLYISCFIQLTAENLLHN